jgi:predicted permease
MQRFSKMHLWLIALIAVIVPRRLRADWRQEWEAELQYREELLAEWEQLNWHSKLALLWHSAGASIDALWLQPKRWEDEMIQDLRCGIRVLLKNPGFTAIAIFTLALGIGVNTALFTVYDAFVLKPLPLKDPESIANLMGYDREGKRNRLFSYLDYVDYRDRNTSFDGLIAWNQFSVPFENQAEDVAGSWVLPANFGVGHLVSGNYFAVLGAEMALGRGFAPEEDRTPGTHPVLVLSHICWTRHFNSDPNVVGKTVRLAGLPFTIIGVTAPGFIGLTPDSPQFWAPLMMRDQLVSNWNHGTWLTERSVDSFDLTGRLKPGVTRAQAQTEMNVIAQQLASAYPDPHRKASVGISSGATFIQLDDEVKPLVAPLLTAVGLVLLIACVNVTNMLLARAAGRQREIAVRLALGASRVRVVRQLLTESVFLAGLGGAAGLLLAIWAIRLIYPLVLAELPVPPLMLETFALDLSPDYRVFAFALLVSLLAGIAAGLAPALQSSRPNLSGALKDEGSTLGAQFSQSRLRNALVVMQIAVCLTLLIAAGLLARNLRKLQAIETGLVTKNVFTLNLSAQGTEPNRLNEFYRQLAARLRTLPGVKSVSQAQRQPLTGPLRTTPITIDGQSQLASRRLQASYNFVSADYFQTLGLRITRGRGFTEQEAQAKAPVVVISESTARRFWPQENPIGKRLGIGVVARQLATEATSDTTANFPLYEIIGLTNDTRQGLIWRRDETFLYLPLSTTSANTKEADKYLIVSTEGDARALMRAAHKEATALDPKLFVLLRLVDDSLSYQMIPFQAVALLAGVLGMLALLLAAIGLYGVMSFIVSQRTREIGIRMALGAQRRDVITLFLRQGGKLIAIGVAIGLAGGAAISSLLAVALIDISQFDPLAFGLVAAFLTLVALSACYVPARRATKVDPMAALRHD